MVFNVNSIQLISRTKIIFSEILLASIVVVFALLLINYAKKNRCNDSSIVTISESVNPIVTQQNVHDVYYKVNQYALDQRFPLESIMILWFISARFFMFSEGRH